MTRIYDWKNNIKENELNNVIETLKNNELVILPTETVYGLAASAFSDEACKKIFTVKGRAQDNPLIVHVANKKMIYDIVERPTEIEEKLIDSFMPGPFTLILNKKKCICDTVTCFRRNSWY
jgi:L-threonylcarbamoyladenylate synthase